MRTIILTLVLAMGCTEPYDSEWDDPPDYYVCVCETDRSLYGDIGDDCTAAAYVEAISPADRDHPEDAASRTCSYGSENSCAPFRNCDCEPADFELDPYCEVVLSDG